MLYHKHSQTIPYYHKQCKIYTVKQAINIIEKHDRYILQADKANNFVIEIEAKTICAKK